ncbi:MAG: hypothetical protein MUP86_03565 [Dehalococcoidia bacterium]|nr:hypothetical protein [Dehalococcoidia bacterium]
MTTFRLALESPPVIEVAGLPSCDACLDPASASPADGSALHPADTIGLSLRAVADAPESGPM